MGETSEVPGEPVDVPAAVLVSSDIASGAGSDTQVAEYTPNLEERIAAAFRALRAELADLTNQATQQLGSAYDAIGTAEKHVFEHLQSWGL
jgi:hypothetical protein